MAFPEGTLVRATGPEVYVIQSGRRCWITSEQLLIAEFGGWGAVQTVDETSLQAIPLGAPIGIPPDGTFFGAAGRPEVFIIEGGQRRWVTHVARLAELGGNMDMVVLIEAENLQSIPLGRTKGIYYRSGLQTLGTKRSELELTGRLERCHSDR